MILIAQKVNLAQEVEKKRKRESINMLEGLPKRKFRKESQIYKTMKNTLQN